MNSENVMSARESSHARKEWVERCRALHHQALKDMLPAGDMRSGLALWRQLHRIELVASRITTALCNGTIEQEAADNQLENLRDKVRVLFCGELPKGFFINRDPRGYALKLEPGSVPYKLHQDWGQYQILAPTID